MSTGLTKTYAYGPTFLVTRLQEREEVHIYVYRYIYIIHVRMCSIWTICWTFALFESSCVIDWSCSSSIPSNLQTAISINSNSFRCTTLQTAIQLCRKVHVPIFHYLEGLGLHLLRMPQASTGRHRPANLPSPDGHGLLENQRKQLKVNRHRGLGLNGK